MKRRDSQPRQLTPDDVERILDAVDGLIDVAEALAKGHAQRIDDSRARSKRLRESAR